MHGILELLMRNRPPSSQYLQIIRRALMLKCGSQVKLRIFRLFHAIIEAD